MNINYRDLVERTAWTAAQAGAAVLLVNGLNYVALGVAGTAAGLAALKVVLAQQTGDGKGDAIPGGVK